MDIHWKNRVLFCGQRTSLTGRMLAVRIKFFFFFLIIEKPATTLVHIPAALINPELQSRIRVFSPYKL